MDLLVGFGLGSKKTSEAGVWVDDEATTACLLCRSTFSFTNRKHHCRQCGKVVCDPCSQNRKVRIGMAKVARGGAAASARRGDATQRAVCGVSAMPSCWRSTAQCSGRLPFALWGRRRPRRHAMHLVQPMPRLCGCCARAAVRCATRERLA